MKAYTNRDFTRWNPLFDKLDPTETLVLSEHPVQIMAAPPALPGLHYVSGFDSASVARHWAHLRKVQPRWMVAVGASQFNEARDFARSVQNDPIRTNVIFRHWKSVLGSFSDNGRMNDLTGAEWIERVGAQHIHAPYWVMADNESAGVQVVRNTADLIPRASSVRLKLAVGAWSSHNPHKADWPLYMPIFERLYQHPEHVYAPHIYYSRGPNSVENLDGFKLVADHLAHVEKVMGAPIPFQVVITEYGRLANPNGTRLDPDKGYALEGLSEAEYADELVWLASAYPKWHFVTFSSGAWGTRGSLGVGKDYEARMEQYASGQVAMPEPPFPPEEAPQYVERALDAGANMRIREPDADGKPNPNGKVLMTVPDGELIDVDVHSVTTPAGQALAWVRVQWLDQRDADAIRLYKGWMGILAGKTLDTQFKDVLTGETPIPDEPTPPDNDDTAEHPAIQFVTKDELLNAIEALDSKWAHYFTDQMAIRDEREKNREARIDALERLLRGLGPYVEKELPLAG